jgi:hypothetical protein
VEQWVFSDTSDANDGASMMTGPDSDQQQPGRWGSSKFIIVLSVLVATALVGSLFLKWAQIQQTPPRRQQRRLSKTPRLNRRFRRRPAAAKTNRLIARNPDQWWSKRGASKAGQPGRLPSPSSSVSPLLTAVTRDWKRRRCWPVSSIGRELQSDLEANRR